MVSARRILTRFRVDLVAGAITWCGMLVMAHPDRLVELVGGEQLEQKLAFELGVYTALIGSSFLAMRWLVRLMRTARRISLKPAHLGMQGALAAEFALVLPIALLLIGTVVQIALISQAYVVAHYAAFAAARSAVVNLNYGIQPGPEWVGGDGADRVKQAACTVLATLSPPDDPTAAWGGGGGGASTAEAQAMHQLLELGRTPAWTGGRYEWRYMYAQAATNVDTQVTYLRSLQPMIPRLEHIFEPALQWQTGYPKGPILPALLQMKDPLPKTFDITIFPGFKAPPPFSSIAIKEQVVTIPMDQLLGSSISAINGALNAALGGMLNLANAAYDWFAQLESVNVDPFSPKEVEVRLEYHFRLAIPSLFNCVPLITEPTPAANAIAGGRAFVLKFNKESRVGRGPLGNFMGHPDYLGVRLQSTGQRGRANGMFPVVLDVHAYKNPKWGQMPWDHGRWNMPFYWSPQISINPPDKNQPSKGKARKKPSDRRLKKDIKRLYDDPRGFGVYEFTYRWESQRRIGVMADEVQKVIPGAVSEISGTGYLAVDYSKL